jgi:hypothetical protein
LPGQLLDHLVGTAEQREREGDAERTDAKNTVTSKTGHYRIWLAFANQAVLTAARLARKSAILLWLPSKLFRHAKVARNGQEKAETR